MRQTQFDCKQKLGVITSDTSTTRQVVDRGSGMPKRVGLVAVLGMAAVCAGLSGCVPLVLVGGTAGAVGLEASEKRGIGGFSDDIGIQASINDIWFKESPGMHARLDMTVDEGRVLLTGHAKDAEERQLAVRLTWQAKGVKEVYNEIQVGGGGFSDGAKDSWITTQLRSALTFDGGVSSQNYSITTVDGVVYLLGTAKSQGELDKVTGHARTIAGVQRVVTHVVVPN